MRCRGTNRLLFAGAARLMWMLLFFGCTAGGEAPSGTVIEVWVHSGRQSEREIIQAQVQEFNSTHPDLQVVLEVLPEGSYNGQVQAAALADDLPDIVEFDGPYVSSYVWQGKLRPLKGLLDEGVIADLLPSIVAQGQYRGRLFSVGTFDSGLGLYARRSALEALGVPLPGTPDAAWGVDLFDEILERLAEKDPDGQVIDLKCNYIGEWYTYGFSPAIQSAGGDLIDRRTFDTAKNVLNGPAAVSAMARIQSWFARGRVDPNLDDAAFVSGRVALSWVGHWEYARYAAAARDDLAILPLPDFGAGTRSGQGSWNWGITTRSKHPRAAARFLSFLLEPEQVLRISNANGAVPATFSAIAESPRYAPGGPLHLFVRQLRDKVTVPRPQTPAYPIISSVFERAFQDIRDGAPIKNTLDQAVQTIDEDIRDNHGYPWLFADALGVP